MAQKTLLQLVQIIQAEMNMPQATAVISSQNQNVLKLLGLIRAACDDLGNEYDWPVLLREFTFTTSDGVETYDLPTDLFRFVDTTIVDTTNQWVINGPLTSTQWRATTLRPASTPNFQYRIINGEMQLTPTPGGTDTTFVYEYISNSFVRSSGGDEQSDFEDDDDVCVFDHRLVVYLVKLKWFASINADTTNALVDYERALSAAKSNSKPAPRLNLGGGSSDRALMSTANFPEGNFG